MISLHDGGNFVALMDRGHVDKEGFCLEALADFGRKVPVADVSHIYGRWVPVAEHPGMMEFHQSKRGPGAFACTHWEP